MRNSSSFDSIDIPVVGSDPSLQKESDVKLKLGLFELVFHGVLLMLIV